MLVCMPIPPQKVLLIPYLKRIRPEPLLLAFPFQTASSNSHLQRTTCAPKSHLWSSTILRHQRLPERNLLYLRQRLRRAARDRREALTGWPDTAEVVSTVLRSL